MWRPSASSRAATTSTRTDNADPNFFQASPRRALAGTHEGAADRPRRRPHRVPAPGAESHQPLVAKRIVDWWRPTIPATASWWPWRASTSPRQHGGRPDPGIARRPGNDRRGTAIPARMRSCFTWRSMSPTWMPRAAYGRCSAAVTPQHATTYPGSTSISSTTRFPAPGPAVPGPERTGGWATWMVLMLHWPGVDAARLAIWPGGLP